MPLLSRPGASTLPLAMLRCLEALDPAIFLHGHRVSRFARLTGEAMGLGEDALASLGLAARLHDVGKLFIPASLVHKEAAFNPEEYRVMQRHAVLGARLLEGHPETADLAEVVHHHHDRWDGRGYPSHASGTGIPLLARITTLADAYDAMTSDRSGGNRSHDAAMGEILRCRGAQFCPESVEAFLLAESSVWTWLAS